VFVLVGTPGTRGKAAIHASPAQIRSVLEIYRAFPTNAKFNAQQRDPNNVPLFLAAETDRSLPS
jgi:hypothetical protein